MVTAPTDIGDQARGWLKELRKTFDARRAQYVRAFISGGYSTIEGRNRLVQATMYAWLGERLPKPAMMAYPTFTLFRRRLTVLQFWECFEGLVLNQALELPGEPPIEFGGKLEEPTLHSGASYPFYSHWPFVLGKLGAANDSRVIHKKLSMVKGDLFPGPQDALEEWTGVSTGYSGFSPAVYCVFPDFHARITSVEIGAETVRVKAVKGPISPSELKVKYYAKAAGRLPKHGEERITKGSATCRVGFSPESFLVDLYDARSKFPLDWRDYDVRSTIPPSDIHFSSSADNLRNVIRGGESLYVEFKSRLPAEELPESICAFANTRGGTVIVGVDKNSKILGFSHPKYGPDHIDNVIGSTLDPVPKYTIRSVRLGGKPLMVIQVPEGTAKPYTLRQRGVFVRSNATDRVADRNETIELCNPKPGT